MINECRRIWEVAGQKLIIQKPIAVLHMGSSQVGNIKPSKEFIHNSDSIYESSSNKLNKECAGRTL